MDETLGSIASGKWSLQSRLAGAEKAEQLGYKLPNGKITMFLDRNVFFLSSFFFLSVTYLKRMLWLVLKEKLAIKLLWNGLVGLMEDRANSSKSGGDQALYPEKRGFLAEWKKALKHTRQSQSQKESLLKKE